MPLKTTDIFNSQTSLIVKPKLNIQSLPRCFKFPHFNSCWFGCLTECCIFYQSAALPPLAAPAQTWKPTSANMNTSMTLTTAAAASVEVGSALLVFSTQQLEADSGS